MREPQAAVRPPVGSRRRETHVQRHVPPPMNAATSENPTSFSAGSRLNRYFYFTGAGLREWRRAPFAGRAWIETSVAVDVYVSGGEKETLWVECAMWGERGQKVAEYVTKGSSVTVQGRVSLGSYEGNPKLKLDVQELTLQGGKPNEGEQRGTKPGGGQKYEGRKATAPVQSNDPFIGDDIPF